jgi:2-keto-3-deoxy-L-rhamnonate aldolase RhmA
MAQTRPSHTEFRRRLRAREKLFGTFVKLPTTQAIEIFGAVGLDFVVIDQEHAPLDKPTTDMMILAARAANVAAIVRLGDPTPGNILNVLDVGAAGVMIPHVDSVERAKEIVSACRYKGGTRGFAGLTRASGWGTAPMFRHIAAQDDGVACIAMIEDLHAVERTQAIASVDGIDGIFIGRGDLTAALGEDGGSRIGGLTEAVARGVEAAGNAFVALVTGKDDAERMKQLGASAVLYASDHNFLRAGAAAALKDFG